MAKQLAWVCYGILIGVAGMASAAEPQSTAASAAGKSKAQTVLDQAAASGKYTFLVFYKEENFAFKRMTEVINTNLLKQGDKATSTLVQVANPAEQAVVERFQASRAPMPLTLAVAPNGAITGIFSKEMTTERFEEAFVTPTMMQCMKSLQDNRLVFVCVNKTEKSLIPNGVKEMQQDPQFKDRIVVVSMRISDPEETRFLGQMAIDPKSTIAPTTAVLLAPPGVMIGKYDSMSTGAQIASALHLAGKCCDDPNCKHNHAPAPQASKPSTTKRK